MATPLAAWQEPDGAPVPFTDAKNAWSTAAREALIDTARRYHGYVTHGQLAETVQERTGIRTKSAIRNWIGEILGTVAEEAHRRGEPPLSALCLRTDQSVGADYTHVIQLLAIPMPEDLDMHAAKARLDCYRFHGARLPADGGRAALPPRIASARTRLANKGTEPAPAQLCPGCFTELPTTGQCDTCG